jgi:hypothetical protein
LKIRNLKKISGVIVALSMLMACTSTNPSNSEVETALRNLWAGYSWEYSSNFDFDNFTRVNGWAEGDDYWVEVKYQVKAKENYYDMVIDCVEPTVASYSATSTGKLTMMLSAMMKQLQGTDALTDYAEYKKTHPEPKKMNVLRAKYKEENLNISFLDCVNHLSEKSAIFNKDLKKGDLADFSINLRFKRTEQGWKNL